MKFISSGINAVTLSTYCDGNRKLPSLAAIAAMASSFFSAADLTTRVTGSSNQSGVVMNGVSGEEISRAGIAFLVQLRKASSALFNL